MRVFEAAAAELDRLKTPLESGLSAEAAAKSRAEHGENLLPEAPRKTIARMLLDALADKTILILCAAAALSLGLQWFQTHLHPEHVPDYIDGVAILCAVLVAAGVATINEARAAKEFQLLSKIRDDISVKLLREGQVKNLSIHEVVVGDLVYLDSGDKLPADGVLLSGVDLSVDQSTVTGESMPVDKGAGDVQLMSGTNVAAGSGVMLVTAVGEASQLGKLHASLQDGGEGMTPLQERLAKLSDRIGVFGASAAVLTFLALALSAYLKGSLQPELSLATGSQLLNFLVVAVTIIVVAVPEGLPLAVTISLAYSVRKMAKENNLVRRLASCETMGAATVVCSDKTGTLTKNRMTVVGGWAAGQTLHEAPRAEQLPAAAREAVAQIAAVNATAFLEEGEGEEPRYVGNPTECALLSLVAGWGEDWRARRAAAEPLRQLGFSSDRKRMCTAVRSEEGAVVLVKGAPEVILERVTRQHGPRGLEPMDFSARAAALTAVNDFAKEGHRTLALALRKLPQGALPPDEALEQELELVAILAIADPVRPEVKGSIQACRGAGVEVKMVTGDNQLTATSIARQIDLLGEGDVVMEGPKFRELPDEELQEILPRLRVLARSIPSDKHRLVTQLKAQGEVVAVTGDGTNDAPAMNAADVGFAMGTTGTEVAKEASDIVLLDDNFASIVSGIQWGRAIFSNIQKFLQFQLTVNVVAISTAFFAALFGYGVPLNPVQLLWVNLIMDTLAALALATEPPTPALLKDKPHGRHAPLITGSMWVNILLIGAVMLLLLMGSLVAPMPAGTTEIERLSFVFNAFVWMQLFNEVNARATGFHRGVFSGLFDNRLFVLVMASTAIGQLLIIEFGGAVFKTAPLSPALWAASVGLGALILPVGGLLRAVGRRLSPAEA